MDKLDREEQDLLNTFNTGKYKSIVKTKSDLQKYQKIAEHSINRKKRINIRLAEKDLENIKRKAIDEGMPYQTLISSIIHKYTIGKLAERKA
jgi:predicted DNA binding CopG/RHH family protein